MTNEFPTFEDFVTITKSRGSSTIGGVGLWGFCKIISNQESLMKILFHSFEYLARFICDELIEDLELNLEFIAFNTVNDVS